MTRFFYFHFFILKYPSYEKLAMMSHSELTRFYDVIIIDKNLNWHHQINNVTDKLNRAIWYFDQNRAFC